MSIKETLLLLDEVATAYPSYYRGRDPNKLARLWQECLQDEDAKDMHFALIAYMMADAKNIPPVPGSLLECVAPMPDLWEEPNHD